MTELQYVRNLRDVGAGDLARAGGKGASLGKMLRSGLPVPPGFVVLTAAYHEFVSANHLAEGIAREVRDLDPHRPEDIRSAAGQIAALFAAGEIPRTVAEEIRQLYRRLGSPRVAVRSSATAEDLPGASFAGQYETYLHVAGEDELLDRVKKCWASLHNERALSYRLRRAPSEHALAHAVVVQQMVEADRSGVLFTADPVDGRRDRVLINAAWGLGEAVVGGEVTPDEWVLEKKSGEVVREAIADKKVMTVRGADGVHTAPVPPGRRRKPTLTGAELRHLLHLGRRAERHFGAPQDLEWSLAGEDLHLLQSRPVTSLFPQPEPAHRGDDLRVYVNMNLYTQGMKEPFTRMGEDAMLAMVSGVAARLMRRYRGERPPWLKSAAGRIFVDVTDLLRSEEMGRALEAGGNDKDPPTLEVLLEVLGRNRTEIIRPGLTRAKIMLGILRGMHPRVLIFFLSSLIKFLYGVFSPTTARRKAVMHGERLLRAMRRESARLRTIEEKLAFIRRRITDVFIVGWEQVFFVAISSADRDRAEAIVRRHLDDTEDLRRVGRSLPHSVTTEMGMDLLRAAERLDRRGVRPGTETEEVRELLSRYGHRSSIELDIGVPEWREEPEYVVSLLRSYIDEQIYAEEMERFRRAAEEAEEAIECIGRRLVQCGAERDAAKVKRLLRRYRAMFGMREQPKFFLREAFSLFRGLLLDVGRELVCEDALDEAGDVFHLRMADIRRGGDLREIARKNHRRYRADLARTPPRVMTSTGETIHAPSSPDEEAMRGVPVSPGVYEGTARILHRPEEGERLRRGDILVTTSTNPAWTPLFLRAGAVVMETGGPISHGSVVAREYGIPAVAGITGATSRIRDGDRVRVDGESGTALLLPEQDGRHDRPGRG